MARSTRRRRGAALAAGLAAATLLAACGGSADDAEDTSEEQGTAEDPGTADEPDAAGPAEAPSSGPPEAGSDGPPVPEDVELPELEGYADLSGQTVEVATPWTGHERDRFDEVVVAFEEATGARVDQLGLGGNPVLAITESLDNGRPPNISFVGDRGLVEALAEDGSIVPLREETLASVEESYAQTWIDLGSVDDEVYAVWLEASTNSLFWYDTAAYAEAGVEAPETWEELGEALRTVSGTGVAGLAVAVDLGWTLTDWFENAYLRVAGPEAYDQLVAREIPWTDPSVVDTLELLGELWSDEEIVLEGGADRTYPDSVENVFGDEPSAATLVGGEIVADSIVGQTDAVVGEDARFYPWPAIEGSAPSVVGDAAGAVAFDEEQGTAELMRYLASPEAANTWIELGGSPAPNRQADLDLYDDDVSRELAQQIVDAEVFRLDMSGLMAPDFGSNQLEGLWPILSDFYDDPSDPEATAQALEDAALDVYGY
ncbi:ABC transporter substrate-binding protein [Georgenia sp. Z1491]|uniref:ABC transporter substrate-binding protein n=1 Tax=Georgenia sp. Z1491 TaxID=3416707 RepID=UPI003CEB43A2